MEQWQDHAIILGMRPHGEHGAIVSLLSEEHGRTAGYVRGAQGTKLRGTLEVGNIVDARWQARNEHDLGTLSLELSRNVSAHFMSDPLKLAALQAACALCEAGLPEREGHPGLFHGLNVLFDVFDSDVWAQAYVLWEIALLKELGFSLDLSRCAGGGDDSALAYVSPKTGRAVSFDAGAPYKEKLLPLPEFLKPSPAEAPDDDVITGLVMTGYFLEHWVFTHHSKGVPEARIRFFERMDNKFSQKSVGKAAEIA